jgi:hypothetical protein
MRRPAFPKCNFTEAGFSIWISNNLQIKYRTTMPQIFAYLPGLKKSEFDLYSVSHLTWNPPGRQAVAAEGELSGNQFSHNAEHGRRMLFFTRTGGWDLHQSQGGPLWLRRKERGEGAGEVRKQNTAVPNVKLWNDGFQWMRIVLLNVFTGKESSSCQHCRELG